MSVSISIRFLTGRAHLHPWQTHHSEGRVEWPPSHWRLLRALVAIAGRGLTSLPIPDFVVDPGKKPKPTKKNSNQSWPPAEYISLPDQWHEEGVDEIPLSRLAGLLATLTATPSIWLPKTAGGHTRQYFPIHLAGIVKNSGSAVFDTFAAVRKDQPVVYQWPNVDLSSQLLADLRLLLDRMAYFGRAESWCRAEVHSQGMKEFLGVVIESRGQSHWECVCIEDGGKPIGKEYRDYILERRLAPLPLESTIDTHGLSHEAFRLFERLKKPKTLKASKSLSKLPKLASFDWSLWGQRLKVIDDKVHADGPWTDAEIATLCEQFQEKEEKKLIKELLTNCMKPQIEFETWKARFNQSTPQNMLLRCLLRESGQDIKDGLERPIGTRWVHYAVPREIYDVPRLTLQPKLRNPETVDLVVYALNTATVHKPVLPALTDTLLVADRFRSAAMAVCGTPSRTLSGHEADDEPCQDHNHAFWWPRDEDNDGFIDHVTVYARAGFQQNEVDALRRLNRLRQRGGRPDLLVTPVFVGRAADYTPWQCNLSNTFISATPYFCPLHLSHGRTGGSRIRSVTNVIRQALHRQGIITDTDEVESIRELIFDYDPKMLPTPDFVNATDKAISPRQYIPVVDPTANPVPLAVRGSEDFPAYPGVCLRDPDQEHPFGLSAGIFVNEGSRFIRTLSFCRNRRGNQVRGHGRMLYIRFRDARLPQPFALGSQCHFGLGLFVCPTSNRSRPGI